MPSPRLSSALGSIAAWTGLTVGGGGTGTLATLALVHRPGAAALAAGAASVAFAAHVAQSAGKALPAIITAVSGLLTARIRARADAKATIIIAAARAELARAGLDPGKVAQAAEMQRALTGNPDLSKDRRPTDETLIKLHGGQRTRNIAASPAQPRTRPVTARRPPGRPLRR